MYFRIGAESYSSPERIENSRVNKVVALWTLLAKFACGQVSSPRLYRLIMMKVLRYLRLSSTYLKYLSYQKFNFGILLKENSISIQERADKLIKMKVFAAVDLWFLGYYDENK